MIINDCNAESYFIGYVNKIKANYGQINQGVLIKLFNVLYYTFFYGSHMWN